MPGLLDVIHDGRERLLSASGQFWYSDLPSETPVLESLVLVFKKSAVAFSIDQNDCIFSGRPGPRKGPPHLTHEISNISPWRESVGLPLLWSWALTNQQGDTDGMQFEFAEDGGAESFVVQIVGLAGEIAVRNVNSEFVDLAALIAQLN